MRQGYPMALAGEVIGLLGGSFDPAHQGHVHISHEALKRFGLSRLWWLVTPGNPLKTHGPASLARRMTRARALMQHPRVVVTDIEAKLGTRYTEQTIGQLRALYPGVHFVWLMGADNLAQFHQWQNWREIAQATPLGIIARPGNQIPAMVSPAARVFASSRIKEQAASLLGRAEAPAWCFVNVPMLDMSSSLIRSQGGWSK